MNGASFWSVLNKGVFSFRLLKPSYTLLIVPIWAQSDDGGAFSVEGLKFYVHNFTPSKNSSVAHFSWNELEVPAKSLLFLMMFSQCSHVFCSGVAPLKESFPLWTAAKLCKKRFGGKEWDPLVSMNWHATGIDWTGLAVLLHFWLFRKKHSQENCCQSDSCHYNTCSR